jgi:sigma-B regulation protein RsbU (phosphoserine phosphatase)
MTQFIDYLSEKYQSTSVDEINRRLLELTSLFEISQILNESLELEHVLSNVLLIPMGRLMIPRGTIILKKHDEYRTEMSKGIPQEHQDKVFAGIGEMPRESCMIDDYEGNSNHPIFQFAKSIKLELCIPFISQNRCLGLALFGPKLTRTPFSEEEINFLNSLASIATSSIENALQLEEIRDVNKRLDERIQELRTLFDIAQGLSATLENSKILKLLIYALMGQMLITRYAILIKKENGFIIQENKGLNDAIVESFSARLLTIDIPEKAILSSDLSDSSLSKSLKKNGIEALAPMVHQNKLLGYILLGSRLSQQELAENDLEFLTTLVSQAVISLENARLFQETLEKQRIEEELNVARNMQKKLLPKTLPSIPDYDIYGVNIPSKQVGGDYYDVIMIDKNHYALAIGDVSGKSVPAALLMANLQAALRVMIKQKIPLTEVVGNLNDLIHNNTDPDKYITFFVGILNRKENLFQYVNAGHNSPILYRQDGSVEELDVGGIILGMLPRYSYKEGKIQFHPGDLFYSYTDGVNEAIDPREEEFGEKRLRGVLSANAKKSSQKVAEAMLGSVSGFANGSPQEDDITMLILKRSS